MELPEFQGAGPTIRFIKIIDQAFDLLNSRSPLARGFKAPIKQNNEHFWSPFLLSTITYLQNFKLQDGTPIVLSTRKTPFIGFIVSLASVAGLYDEYVSSERLQYLLTYKFSQDHIELFFCSIR